MTRNLLYCIVVVGATPLAAWALIQAVLNVYRGHPLEAVLANVLLFLFNIAIIEYTRRRALHVTVADLWRRIFWVYATTASLLAIGYFANRPNWEIRVLEAAIASGIGINVLYKDMTR